MMKLELDADLCILQAVGEDEPEREDCTYALYEGLITWSAPHPTCRLRFIDGAPVWEDSATLDERKARAIADIDRIADASRLMVVGDAARIKEYERAEEQAAAYRDAGFIGDAPPCVACWATAKEWTGQQAAEDILAASARWLGALEGIRALRLQAKEDVRRALDAVEAEAIRANFSATLTAMMQGV